MSPEASYPAEGNILHKNNFTIIIPVFWGIGNKIITIYRIRIEIYIFMQSAVKEK